MAFEFKDLVMDIFLCTFYFYFDIFNFKSSREKNFIYLI